MTYFLTFVVITITLFMVMIVIINLNPPMPQEEMPELIKKARLQSDDSSTSSDGSDEDEDDLEQYHDDWETPELNKVDQLQEKFGSWEREEIEHASLGFDPINTFEPDPNQWLSPPAAPWPRRDESARSDYEHTDLREAAVKDWERAVEWLQDASTSAIHQTDEIRKFMRSMLGFMVRPNAKGAELTREASWRKENRNFSRLIGERLMVLAFGVSCHGPYPMEEHREALLSLMDGEWGRDSLEEPLFEQCLARLQLLSHTDLQDQTEEMNDLLLQELRRSSEDEGEIEIARRNVHLMMVCSGTRYPFPKTDDNLSRLWFPGRHRNPLVNWGNLLPILYSLWIHYWVNPDTARAVQELNAVLEAWLSNQTIELEGDEFKKPPEYFPECWEGILMFCWALAPDHEDIWNRIENQWDQFPTAIRSEENLNDMTQTYLNWHDRASGGDGEPPPQSFTGQRMPPIAWITPLPSTLVREHSEPSFDYPREWCEEFTRWRIPDQDVLERAIPS